MTVYENGRDFLCFNYIGTNWQSQQDVLNVSVTGDARLLNHPAGAEIWLLNSVQCIYEEFHPLLEEKERCKHRLLTMNQGRMIFGSETDIYISSKTAAPVQMLVQLLQPQRRGREPGFQLFFLAGAVELTQTKKTDTWYQIIWCVTGEFMNQILRRENLHLSGTNLRWN